MYTDTLTLYFIDIYQLYTTYIQYTEYKRWIINFNDSSFKDEICIHVQDTYMYIYSYMYYDMEYNCTDLLHTCTCTCILKTMKRNFKQWWTTIPPISTKRTITSHLKSVNIKKDHEICRPFNKGWYHVLLQPKMVFGTSWYY